MNLDKQTESLDKYTRLTNYLSAAQIFLKDNFFLEKKLETKDIKERLLGHWGTCPGINIVYAHTNRLIKNNKDRDFMFVVGPGHGFPAYQSNIFLDGSLSHFYPEKNPFNKKGLVEMIEHFSTPYGHPSHLNPEAPGAVVEGGELGYSLSISSGTVLDNPNLITVCVIGDGEAETGTLASSWHINKFISPKTDGMVLPVLHLNGYKISGPTIFGRMSDHDITKYFEGLGYEVLFIKGESLIDVHKNASLIFDSAISKIINIQNKTRNDNSTSSLQNWPIIILKTEKGMTSVDYINNKKISGNCHSHQIVFDNPKKNQSELVSLESWLRSYHVEELISFDESGKIILDKDIVSLIPELNRSLGFSPYARASNLKEVKLPLFEDIYTDQEYIKEIGFDAMTEAGDYMSNVISLGNDMRLFSPDETYSNKLNNIFKSTKRVWQLPIKEWDEEFSDTGRVVEMLSENVLFGMMWGYTLSGRFGYFATYEAFAEIVASMADQYVKFIKVARDIPWRNKVPAMNVILSSLLERQDHNGFSHQNPSFISNTILRDRDITSVYMPADKI